MTEASDTNSRTTVIETKFTAPQIEQNCPVMLRDLGQRIAVHSEKAQKCEDKAEQHYTTVAQLLAKAHEACDEGGFNAFRKMFFPNLGNSRVYELLAIGTNKKSVEETRAGTRARVAKHRANKAAAAVSVTVTEKPEQAGADQATNSTTDQTPEPSKPRSAVAPGDGALRAFTELVLELDRRTAKRSPERFSATAVPVEVLARLGSLLTGIANIKKSEAKPGPIIALMNKDTVPAGLRTEHAALEANVERVA
jgi:hypothetical protein